MKHGTRALDLQAIQRTSQAYSETVKALEQGQLVPTLNGGVVYLGPETERHPRVVTVSFQTQEEQLMPLFERGACYELDMASTLKETDVTGAEGDGLFSVTQDAVPGSLNAYDSDGRILDVQQREGQAFQVSGVLHHVVYRPRLKAVLTQVQTRVCQDTLSTQVELVFQEDLTTKKEKK